MVTIPSAYKKAYSNKAKTTKGEFIMILYDGTFLFRYIRLELSLCEHKTAKIFLTNIVETAS